MSPRLLIPLAILSSMVCAAQSIPVPDPVVPHDHAVCGTPAVLAGMDPSDPDHARKLQAVSKLCGERDEKQFNFASPGGHFRIHYSTSGPDSVSIVDKDANGIPDYADSVAFYCDMAWKVEVEDYGYTPPPPDNLNAGLGGIDGKLDIYICDLDVGFYGAAFPESGNDVGPNRISGFISLDRDYKEASYSSKGIDGVRVTTAHEFHHLIQFSSYRFAFEQAALYEATSTWFERQVHPSIPDYRQYVDLFLSIPWEHPFSTHEVSKKNHAMGYAHELYMDYVSTKFDRDVVRRFWELFRDNGVCFDAIDIALREKGTNLENSYCEFARWCYYTGYRAKQDGSFLKEAPNYPAMRVEHTVPLDGTALLTSSLQPLAFTLLQVTIPTINPNIRDTVDFLATNARSDIGKGGPQLPADWLSVEVSATAQTGFLPVKINDTRTIYYKFLSGGSNFCLDAISGEIAVAFAVSTTPQPFINDGGNQLMIAVGAVQEEVLTAELTIYSTAMTPIAQVEQTGLRVQNNLLGVLWDGRTETGDLAPSGVYIYELAINGGKPVLGKFAVVKK
jgi:hypothetical protein